MNILDSKQLADDLLEDSKVVGLIQAGSTAKRLQTKDSDLDVYIILDSDTVQNDIVKYTNATHKKYHGKNLDISNQAIQTLNEFKKYGVVGTEYEWDRYNLVHTELIFDKTNGVLAEALESKEILTNNEADTLIDSNLGAYINLTYRSLHSFKAGKKELAKLDQAEAVMYMLTLLFAFKKRVRPFNKYLAWELEQYPLDLNGVDNKQLYELILASATGDNHTHQIKMFKTIERLARKKGRTGVFDAWGEKLYAID